MNSARIRSFFIYGLIIVAILVLLLQLRQNASQTQQLSLREVATAVNRGEVKKIQVDENTLRVSFNGGRPDAESRKEPISTAVEQLIALGADPARFAEGGVDVEVKKPSDLSGILTFLGYMLPARKSA